MVCNRVGRRPTGQKGGLTMRKSLFLTALFVISVLSPMALADVTETQFQDGSTSYTHTFTGTGDGFAGDVRHCRRAFLDHVG